MIVANRWAITIMVVESKHSLIVCVIFASISKSTLLVASLHNKNLGLLEESSSEAEELALALRKVVALCTRRQRGTEQTKDHSPTATNESRFANWLSFNSAGSSVSGNKCTRRSAS